MRYEDHYVMAVYETDENERNCVSFYVSEDFHTWRRTSRSDNLYECPDIFPLPIEGEEWTKWVLYGADGMARIGDFDGYHFVESGHYNPLDYGSATYAGQTWSHHPEGKRVHISWIRGMGGAGEDLGYEGMPFSQCMSIPAEIFLKRFQDGLRVCRRPVDQVDSLFGAVASEADFQLQGETALPMHNPAHYSVNLSAIQGTVSIRAGEHRIRFDSSSRTLSFENGHAAVFDGENLHFQVLADTTTMEFCFQDSVMATYAMAPEHMSLIVKGKCRAQYVCHAVENVWEQGMEPSNE
nr:hypothetical protein [uncultured Acetatifactor sp.]